MVEELFEQMKKDMQKVLDFCRREFNRVRTGRPSLSLLDGIKVNYYGTMSPLNQVATLSIPESRLITIQPWDTKMLEEIEKAILKSDIGLTPMNDGKIIRIAIPGLTEERRKELVKMVKKMAEDRKIDIRNHRREAIEKLRNMKKQKEISEDDLYRYQDEAQKITNQYVSKIDELLAEKEKEILEV